MTAPIRLEPAEEDPLEALMALKGQRDPLDDLMATKRPPSVKPDVSSALARNRPNASGDFQSALRGADDLAYKTLAAEANLIRGIKPLAMLQTGARALLRGQSYDEAKSDLAAADESLPSGVRTASRVAGALPATMLAPGSTIPQMMASGAMFGAAEGMTDDPNVSTAGAVGRMAGGAAAGAGTAGLFGGAVRGGEKVTKLAKLRSRINKADDFDESAVARDKDITAATKENYGRAAAEGEVTPTSPVLQKALERPLIKKYADMIRGEGEGPMSDADLARAVYRRMSEARLGHKSSMDRLGYSDDRAAEVRQLARELKTLKEATASASQKPPITMEVAGERTVVGPRVVNPGREPQTGPIPGYGTTTTPFKHAGPRDETGRLRTDLHNVPDEALETEWRRLAELNQREEALHGAVKDARYRTDYEELPRTEKFGHKGKEDLPDADGMIDPEILAADNKIVSDYNRSVIVRRARQQAMERIDAEMAKRPPRPVAEVDDDVSFDFGANVKDAPRLGPTGPDFMLRGQTRKVTPGVEIETPAMRVTTAPAEAVPPVMPSFPRAVAEKARMEGEREAASEAADVASRVARGLRSPPKKAHFKSPAAFLDKIKSGEVPPNEIEAALPAFLSGAKPEVSLLPKWSPQQTLFGTVTGLARPVGRLNRLSPFVDALDLQAGNAVRQPLELQELLRALGLATAVTP